MYVRRNCQVGQLLYAPPVENPVVSDVVPKKLLRELGNGCAILVGKLELMTPINTLTTTRTTGNIKFYVRERRCD